MKELYRKFLKLNIDLSPMSVMRRESEGGYFCTPKGAEVIGWAGADGIHFCFVRGFGETVFAVSPMNTPGNFVRPLASSFADFLRLLIACGDSAALEQAHGWDKAQFEDFLRDHPVSEEQQAVIDEIGEKLKLGPMDKPFEYIKELQTGFDYAKIRYTEDYEEWAPAEPKQPEWKVTFEGNFWSRGIRERGGLEVPVNREFNWSGKRWLVPAVYSCAKGLVLDCCVRVEPEDIRAFIDKWKLDREDDDLSCFTKEDRMRIEAENPLSLRFRARVKSDGKELKSHHGCGTYYNPCAVEFMPSELDAKWLVEYYGLDPSFGWVIWRDCFPWKGRRPKEITSLSITLTPELTDIPGPRFTVNAPGDTFSFDCPLTGQTHTLTVQDIEHQDLPADRMAFSDMELPRHCLAMSYTLAPELPRDAFQLSDSAESDQPRPKQTPDNFVPASAASIGIIGGANGPTAIILGGRGQGVPRTVCSSLHFEPAENVEWSITFREKRFEDISVDLI